MEIDVSGIAHHHNKRALLLGMTLALALVIFGLVGKPYTVPDLEGYPLVLTWSDWRLFSAERAYRAELQQLRQEADLLIEFLNAAPDPVRAQLTAERIARQYSSGLPVLEHQRGLLIAAAEDVQSWSVGAVSRDQAVFSTDALVAGLQLPDGSEPAEEAPAVQVTEEVPTTIPTPTPES